MKINMPIEAHIIIDTLEKFGYEAYIVGGCVRDSILGKEPYDWDITTSALPEQIMESFTNFKIVETGLKHGTVTIVINHKPFEITTYRIDGTYSDCRRPDYVEFTQNLYEDLSRRDFTINAMAYNDKDGLQDPFGGYKDLQKKVIRCVGDAELRFGEDALRIFRAIRFSSVLGFEVEEKTKQAIFDKKELLKKVSIERIETEFSKMLKGAKAVELIDEYREIIALFIPEIQAMFGFKQNNKYHIYDVWNHTLKSMEQTNDWFIKLTMLLHDIGKPLCYTEDEKGGHFYLHNIKGAAMAKDILTRLRFDNETINDISQLVLVHDDLKKASSRSIKRMLNRIGERQFERLLEVMRCDTKAHNPEYISRLEEIDKIEILFKEIIVSNQCFNLKQLEIGGNDLINIGIAKGKLIGQTLNSLLEMVINNELENDKEQLLNKAKEINNL